MHHVHGDVGNLKVWHTVIVELPYHVLRIIFCAVEAQLALSTIEIAIDLSVCHDGVFFFFLCLWARDNWHGNVPMQCWIPGRAHVAYGSVLDQVFSPSLVFMHFQMVPTPAPARLVATWPIPLDALPILVVFVRFYSFSVSAFLLPLDVLPIMIGFVAHLFL